MGHKLVLVVFSTIATVAFSADEPPGGYYHSKYDYVDIQDVLNQKRLVQHYAACLLNRRPCPPEGADLKRILPEALETNCLRCTEKQKEGAYKTIQRLKDEYNSLFKEVQDMYDPTGEYIAKFEQGFVQKVPIEDQENLLANRFGDEASANDLVPAVKPSPAGFPYPTAVSPSSSSTTTSTPTSTTTTTRTTTTTATSTARPTPPRQTLTQRPSFLTIWQQQTRPSTYGWRPTTASATQQVLYGPLQTLPPPDLFKVTDTGVQLLGSISDIGNKVLEAGTQVAGMLLSTVKLLVGH